MSFSSLPAGTYAVVLETTKAFLCRGDTDWNEPSFTRAVTLTGELEVLPASAPEVVELVGDPTLAQGFRDAITFRLEDRAFFGKEKEPGIAMLVIEVLGTVPMDGAFTLSVVAGDREVEVGSLITRRRNDGITSETQRRVRDPGESQTLIPVLRSSTDVAKETPDLFRIWDGEIRFDPLTMAEQRDP